MKKLLILLIFLTVLVVAGCVEEEIDDPWGIQLKATEITPTGMTLVCKQSGGEPTGELLTGSYYRLEKSINGEWVPVEMLPIGDICWTDEAWIIPKNDAVEWGVAWEWLYGELPDGNYRIGKEIMDFRGPGDFDKKIYYANFEVTN